MCTIPGCERIDRHAHSRGSHTGMTLDHIAFEAMGFCPESGAPFEMCIDGPCVCPLTRETVTQYIIDVGTDLAAIRAGREEA